MASTDASLTPTKGKAFRAYMAILDSSGALVTGTLSGMDTEISQDGAAFGDATNEFTQIGTTWGIGYIELTADEMDNDAICGVVQTTQGADMPFVIYPGKPFDVPGMAQIFDLIESQRGRHTSRVAPFYVDPTNGDTIANGATGTRHNPLSTVTEALTLCTDSAHDLIILVPGASGQTTLTEAVTISKRYVSIRGPGRDFIWTRSGAGDTISITADGVSISGVRVQTAATGAGSGIDISGADFAGIYRCWFENTRGDGVNVSDASNTIIDSCVFEEAGASGAGNGIEVDVAGGTSNHTFIRGCHISNSPNDGIRITGAAEDTVIEDCSIHGSGGWGIDLGTSVDSMVVNCSFGQNTSGDIDDSSAVTASVLRPAMTGADGDTLETLSDEIATIPGLGTGARAITITIEDQNTDPVSDVLVEVYNQANDTFQGIGARTDSNGQVEFNLDDDTYTIRQRRVNYTPDDASETLVVSDDASVTYSGTITTVTAPTLPSGCMVHGTIILGNAALQSVTVKMRSIREDGQPQQASDNLLAIDERSDTTDAAGYFELEFPQETFVLVDIPQLKFKKVIELPAASTYDISDEID
jgi:parallel beta-helix repeat protein